MKKESFESYHPQHSYKKPPNLKENLTNIQKAPNHYYALFPAERSEVGTNKLKCQKNKPLGAHLTKNLRRVALFDGTLTAYNSG